MILAFFIAFFSLAVLIVLLLLTRGYSKSIHELAELAGQTRPVDIEAFRNIIDPSEEDFLRANLPASELRAVQRQRLLAAAEYVGNVAHNAALLLRLGQAGLHNPANLGALISRLTGKPLGPRPVLKLGSTSPFHEVASWASTEFGFWNQERVTPTFR
jgi:hypothetical protein